MNTINSLTCWLHTTCGSLFKCLPATNCTHSFSCRRYKQYKPIERSAGQAENQEGLSAYFSNFKAFFFPRSTERNPLLKTKPGIV